MCSRAPAQQGLNLGHLRQENRARVPTAACDPEDAGGVACAPGPKRRFARVFCTAGFLLIMFLAAHPTVQDAGAIEQSSVGRQHAQRRTPVQPRKRPSRIRPFPSVPAWGVTELTVIRSAASLSPLQRQLELKLDVTLTAPDATEFSIRGFYYGAHPWHPTLGIWKARFTPNQEGAWRWQSHLGGVRHAGRFHVTPNAGDHGLLRPGTGSGADVLFWSGGAKAGLPHFGVGIAGEGIAFSPESLGNPRPSQCDVSGTAHDPQCTATFPTKCAGDACDCVGLDDQHQCQVQCSPASDPSDIGTYVATGKLCLDDPDDALGPHVLPTTANVIDNPNVFDPAAPLVDMPGYALDAIVSPADYTTWGAYHDAYAQHGFNHIRTTAPWGFPGFTAGVSTNYPQVPDWLPRCTWAKEDSSFSLDNGRQIDEMMRELTKRGYVIQFMMFFNAQGTNPPSYRWGTGQMQTQYPFYVDDSPSQEDCYDASVDTTTPEAIEYLVARWGAYVDIWELTNEAYLNADWRALAFDAVREADPYGKPVLSNWNYDSPAGGAQSCVNAPCAQTFPAFGDTVLGQSDLNSAHLYDSDTRQAAFGPGSMSAAIVFNQARSFQRPVAFGERGECLDAGFDAHKDCWVDDGRWVPEDHTNRVRWNNYLAFFQKTSLQWFILNAVPHTRNASYGPAEREQTARLVEYMATFDGMEQMEIPRTSANVKGRALSRPDRYAAYLLNVSRSGDATDETIVVTIPFRKIGAFTFLNPADHRVIRTGTLPSGSHPVRIPAFPVDMLFDMTVSDDLGSVTNSRR